jgi:hypothetical protein
MRCWRTAELWRKEEEAQPTGKPNLSFRFLGPVRRVCEGPWTYRVLTKPSILAPGLAYTQCVKI